MKICCKKTTCIWHGLQAKAMLGIIILLFFVAFSLTIFFIRYERNIIHTQLKEKGLSIAENLAHNSEYGIFVHNKQVLQKLTENVMKNHDVSYVIIEDNNEKMIASDFLKDTNETHRDCITLVKDDTIDSPIIRLCRKSSDSSLYDIMVPVKIGKGESFFDGEPELPQEYMSDNTEIIGFVRIGISTKSADILVTRSKNIAILISLCIFVIAVSLTIILVQTVGRPIRQVVIGTQKVAAGDLTYQVKITSRDEIGELASSFNQMTHSLKEAKETIEDYSRTLEKKVDERTRELVKANEEIKQTQSQLIQSGKMAAVGELGAGVAHELNNPLTGILGYAQYLLDKTKKVDFTPDDFKVCARQIEYIEKEAQRCKNIVHELLKFSRKSHDKFEPLNVNQVIEDTLGLVGHQLTMNNITIIKELEPNLKKISGNDNQLQQVFTNIIINAQQAMSNKGELRIGTRNKDESIEIEFTDTGCGIPGENLKKIFDPFFTTKKDWRGTGLGLSISYKIIQDHKGIISVKSEVGKGTIFIITLPV